MSAVSSKLQKAGLTIAPAKEEDGPVIHQMVDAAYSKYIERIGRPPAPMLTNYSALVKSGDEEVYVLRQGDIVQGSIILCKDDDSNSIKVNNLVVSPHSQGKGFGRLLMDFAHDLALERGLKAITLYTNVKMYENIGLYTKLGFHETERKTEGPYERVYFRKNLA